MWLMPLSWTSPGRPAAAKAGWRWVSESKRLPQLINMNLQYNGSIMLDSDVKGEEELDWVWLLWFTCTHSPCSLSTPGLLGLGNHHPGHRSQNDRHTRHPEGRDRKTGHLVRWDIDRFPASLESASGLVKLTRRDTEDTQAIIYVDSIQHTQCLKASERQS